MTITDQAKRAAAAAMRDAAMQAGIEAVSAVAEHVRAFIADGRPGGPISVTTYASIHSNGERCPIAVKMMVALDAVEVAEMDAARAAQQVPS